MNLEWSVGSNHWEVERNVDVVKKKKRRWRIEGRGDG